MAVISDCICRTPRIPHALGGYPLNNLSTPLSKALMFFDELSDRALLSEPRQISCLLFVSNRSTTRVPTLVRVSRCRRLSRLSTPTPPPSAAEVVIKGVESLLISGHFDGYPFDIWMTTLTKRPRWHLSRYSWFLHSHPGFWFALRALM